MLVRRIRVRGWRNLAEEEVELGDRVTALYGRNGQGKSNLVEAIYYAVAFRSFRTNSTVDLIMWGQEAASVEAEITLRGLTRELRVELGVGRKRSTLDGKIVRRDADALAGAAVVLFGPDDLRLLKAPAAERRRALDRTVFAVHRTYFREALAFERALRARNSLLRSGGLSPTLLESYDETLARTGARMVVRRRTVAAELGPGFSVAFRDIQGDAVSAMRYRSADGIEDGACEEEIVDAIRRGLHQEREVDIRRGFTGFGPQTDDLEVTLDGRPAKEHGSQGQLRSLVLALKFAELRLVEERNGETPVLLLDDVASELDVNRRGRLFETIAAIACQTVLTVTERELLPSLPGRVDFEVSAGKIARG